MFVYVGFKYPHHGRYSGYDQLRYFLPYSRSVREERLFILWLMRLFKPVLKRIVNYEKRYYQLFTMVAKLKCLFLKNSVIHFIYPESFIFTKKYLHPSNRIAATFHLPPEEYEKLNIQLRNKHIQVDLAIVMSLELKDYFSGIFGEKKVVYLPHGINTDFFRPSADIQRKNRIVVVGNWLRDFELASAVFKLINNERKDIEYIVISLQNNNHYFTNQDYVTYLAGISDEELLAYYQSSKVLFLPLKSFTANNAVLEAGASGCEILIATSRPEESYFNSDQVAITGIDPSIISAKLIEMIDHYDSIIQENLIAFIREKYSWQAVAKCTVQIFNTIT